MITAVNGHTKRSKNAQKVKEPFAICVDGELVCVCAYDAKHKKTPDIQTLLPLVLLFFHMSCAKKGCSLREPYKLLTVCLAPIVKLDVRPVASV